MADYAPEAVDLSKYIEARLFEERPHIRNRRIPVALVVQRMRANGWTVAETAYDFSLSEAEIVAAILYYEEHQAEIEAQEVEEAAQFEKMKQQYQAS